MGIPTYFKNIFYKYNNVLIKNEDVEVDNFYNEYIEETGNDDDLLKINTIYDFYQEFYEDNDGFPEASKKELKKYLSGRCGKYSKNGYVGYKITEVDSE